MDQRVLYTHVPQDHAPVHATMDVTAYSILGVSVMGWLPSVAGVVASSLSAVYFLIQIALALRAWRRGKDKDE